jgi:hypothetical protein
MIIALKDGRSYELTRDDQEEIRLLAIANGGDVQRAIEEFHLKKFGVPLNQEPPVAVE